MNLRQLESFLRVAELGSFSRAALVLGLAQPALSRQIRLLEEDLGAKLLRRTGRGAIPTEAGARLREHAGGILRLAAQAREDLAAERGEPTGRIVIALPPSMARLLTLRLVEGFRAALPRARLAVVEGLSTHIGEWIATGRVDLGLVLNPSPLGAIETRPILDEALCLVSPARPRAPSAKLPFAELARYPLVIPEPMHVIRKLVETEAARARLSLDIAWEISGVPAILELVRTGHGHAVLTEGAVRASGQAAAFGLRRITSPDLTSRLCLAVPARGPLSPLMQAAIRLLEGLVRAHSNPL
ncbi:MAG: LysR family transcriptional regulator [Rhodospirillales bacterium]|nr:LysR family transcriptional regulator [Rhodospirillales bacterium]